MAVNAEGSTKYRTHGACLDALAALVFAFEVKGQYASCHSERVADTGTAIGKALGLASHLVEKIGIAGRIHDIGKVGIPEPILNKPGLLTTEEYLCVQSHCEVGERILRPMVKDPEVLNMVKHHHERLDGRGYPDGLSGGQISVGSRILAVADAYDAMTSDRPYRLAMESTAVVAELERGKGSQFDPDVVDVLLKIMDTVSPITASTA